jgi:hypothetical protein
MTGSPGKLTLTVTVGQIDHRLERLIARAVAADEAVEGTPDLVHTPEVESAALVLWQRLSALMRLLSDEIIVRRAAADQAGIGQLDDVERAIGAYEATEKIRTELVGALIR